MFTAPIHKDLVLVGGGHSHVEVLRKFGMRPLPGVRLTLITRDVHTPYSGMLPGYISGFYSFDECHIDLERLARFANARLIHAEATGIDIKAEEVLLEGRPPLPYDVLSINVGITPEASTTPGAAQYSIPVKPIDKFVARFDEILTQVRSSTAVQYRVVVVGGGAGGIEVACALKYRLDQEISDTASVDVTLISRGSILPSQAPYARSSFLNLLKDRGIHLLEGLSVAQVLPHTVVLDNGQQVAFDNCVWCTQAGAASWFADSGLPVDANGFVLVNEFFQVDGGPGNVFAAGDASGSKVHPRPKAGVYAVRAGPPLAENLRRQLESQPLVAYKPQSTNLALITAGDKYCVAVKGSWLRIQGSWLWNWKDRIDRKFMDKYSTDLSFENMMGNSTSGSRNGSTSNSAYGSFTTPDQLSLLAASKMRCAGCGGKVGASVLSRVLQRLQQDSNKANTNIPPSPASSDIVIGLTSPDDAAVLAAPPPGHVTIHTVDYFRAPMQDPFLFGQIAATHALSDCHAMGAKPVAALAIAVLPFGAPAKVEADLYQLMAGASQVLRADGCQLVGGHSSEGSELGLGFSVYGTAPQSALLTKAGFKPGQALILTKPLGQGAIMAAAMHGLSKGRYVTAAQRNMVRSNGPAAEVLVRHGATAATDVTGFGLLGHLAEMCKASGLAAEVDTKALPLVEGSLESVATGKLSSLYEENSRVAAVVKNASEAVEHSLWPLLVDPQTGGGLLAAVPAENADVCVKELQEVGYIQATVIGRVLEGHMTDARPSDNNGPPQQSLIQLRFS